MLSQGASKVNISFVVPADREKEVMRMIKLPMAADYSRIAAESRTRHTHYSQVIRELHDCFFEDNCIVEMECLAPDSVMSDEEVRR